MRVEGVPLLLVRLNQMSKQAWQGATSGAVNGLMSGEGITKGFALSGRPGPIPRTFDFSRSINADWEIRGDQMVGQIGTNAPQALRLENGFFGADRLGRVYNQPAYPTFTPAAPFVMDTMLAFTASGVERALR